MFTSKRSRELTAIITFYFFFSILYHIVLWYNGGGSARDGMLGWLNPYDFWLASGRQYFFLFLNSVFIWWVAIYLLRNQPAFLQMLVVFLLIPPTVYYLRELRYSIIDKLGMSRLTGTGTIWDWYIPSLFMLIQFGVYFAYRYFTEHQQKLEQEAALKQAALKSELAAIKAQLNPHFLYNVFNTINAALPPENEKAREMIAQLSDLFRYQLQATREDEVTLREELEFVRKYLELERARFEDRLQVTINAPAELLNEKVPPMLLQPLVENSIKHGLSGLIEGGTIVVSVNKKGKKLHFEISDTGVGVADKSNIFDVGVGLTNTKLRLQKMYDSSLEVMDNVPKGLMIKFSI